MSCVDGWEVRGYNLADISRTLHLLAERLSEFFKSFATYQQPIRVEYRLCQQTGIE